jgi:hypothetical protein
MNIRRTDWARIGAGCAAAALIATTLSPAVAAAKTPRLPKPLDQRTFKVDVTGVQTTTWTLNRASTARCDPAMTGHGREQITFRSTRPERMDARRYGTSYVIFGDPFKVGANDFVLRATVTRTGSMSSTPVPRDCGDNGGADHQIPPDCGTKRTRLDLQLGWLNEPRHGFTLTAGDLGTLGDPFKNCPWVEGTHFPDVLEKQHKRAIVAAMPVSDLFNRKFGQQITIGRGSNRLTGGGVNALTRIRWDVRLTGVRR